MKHWAYFYSILLLMGCTKSITKNNLRYLNGYWEIEEVVFSNGKTKKYNLSTTIDYIEIDSLKGFRKKMQPNFNGSYTTSNDAELFTIVENNGSFELYYQNELSEWTEKITMLTNTNFSVINQDTITYKYKRFTPINIKSNGKTKKR